MFTPGRPLHNETQRHVARLSVRNSDHIEDLDILIRGLVDAGIWARLAVLCVAGPNSADSLLDLKGTQDSALVGAPAFAADAGFTTVSTTDLINTQFTMDSSFTTNLSLSIYTRLSPGAAANVDFMGESDGSIVNSIGKLSASLCLVGLQSSNSSAVVLSGGGFKSCAREDTDTLAWAVDGASGQFSVTSGVWGTRYPLIVGARNVAGTYTAPIEDQYAHWSAGKGLSASQLLAYNILIKAYLTRRGTAV